MKPTLKPNPMKCKYINSRFLSAIVTIILCVAAFTANAQVKKGERLMTEGLYDEAIKAFKKDFFGKKPDPLAGYWLAQAYYQSKKYEDANDIIDLIQNEMDESTERVLFATDVLIANEKFSEAYLNIIRHIADNPDDADAYIWLNKISDLIRWDTIQNANKVNAVAGINTVYNEYAPYLTKDGNLWYITDINSMQAIFPASYSGQNIHLIYKTIYDYGRQDVNKPTMLVRNRKYYDHDGPLSAWPGRELHAVTMRDIDAPVETARIGIFFIDLQKGADPMPFIHNDEYDTGHPTFNEDGSRMFFASNRPGGMGNMDIWYCDWKNGAWGPPQNMGPVVNTSGNEVFPRYQEGRMYFSSDRRDMGYGGLDLYFTSEMLDFKTLYNLREPINSAHDDFSVTLADYNFGFFASNRPGGTGGDDVFSFAFFPEQIEHQERFAKFDGEALEAGTRIIVENGRGEVEKETVLMADNIFSLSGLKSRETYTVKVPRKSAEVYEMHVLNDEGNIAQTYLSSKGDVFRIELLDPEDYSMGTSDAEDVGIASFEMKGTLRNNEVEDWSSTKVRVQSESSKLIMEVLAEASGDFSFSGLNYDEVYNIMVDSEHEVQEIDLTGSTGNIIQSMQPLPSGSYTYTRQLPAANWMLASDIEVSMVQAVIVSEGVAFPDEVHLVETSTGNSESIKVDEDGFLKLPVLKTQNAYELRMPNGALLAKDRLLLLDAYGGTSQSIRPHGERLFQFEYMLYDNYGEKVEPIAEDVKPKEGKRYRAVIEGVSLSPDMVTILAEADGTRTDSLKVDPDGAVELDYMATNQAYNLSLLQSTMDDNARLFIYNENGDLVFETGPENPKEFKFTLLDDEDYALGNSGAEDVQISQFSFAGKALIPTSDDALAVNIYDSIGVLLSEGYATRAGDFNFTELPEYSKYILHFPEQAPTRVGVKVDRGQRIVEGRPLGDQRYLIDLKQPSIPFGEFMEELEAKERREFTVPHVYYNFNSYYLKEESRKSLDMLTRYLRQNMDVEIEIRSYTDSRGTVDYNLLLSERRANEVKKYLTGKGIKEQRLSLRGFGEGALVNDCTDGVECSEEEHAANRRTTFVILND